MNIRGYKQTDRDACLDLFRSNIPKFFLPHELDGFVDYLAKYSGANYWVLEHEGELIACGGYGIRGSEGRLHYGMVANRWHKKGVGSKLLLHRLMKLVENPAITEISLDTSQHNPTFFARFGFVETSNQPNAYGEGLHRHDMRWVLPPDRQSVISQIKTKMLKIS